MAVDLLLVEDDARLRAAIGNGLRTRSGTSVTTAGSKSEALAVLAQRRFDLAIVDLGLPDGSGLDVIGELHKRGGRSLVLTVFADERSVLSAVARGAAGYLLKSDSIDTLNTCIEQCLRGASPISAEAARHLFTNHRQPPSDPLTPRERELLVLLARGSSYAECARELDIGVGTVQTHVKALYRKLDVCSKAEAATWAARHGVS